MSRTLPRTTWGTQRLASVLFLLCFVGLAIGTFVKRDTSNRRIKKAAAHLEATLPINGSLKWTTDTDSAFVNGELSLINNEVYIKQKGLYFVYTQATFKIVDCPGTSFLLSHAVILKSIRQQDRIQLLHAQKTVCEEKKSSQSTNLPVSLGWRKSIFQGGVFQLEKGDKLYTDTLQMSNLLHEGGETYFGLYAL
ncbi:lymphotoxin-alpha-like [Pyxicephalus adspersus]